MKIIISYIFNLTIIITFDWIVSIQVLHFYKRNISVLLNTFTTNYILNSKTTIKLKPKIKLIDFVHIDCYVTYINILYLFYRNVKIKK